MTTMLRTALFGLVLALASAPAFAQKVEVGVRVTLPAIRFTVAPPLVVVAPGVQVVPDHDEEVFFVDGWWWCRWGGRWFRARDHLGGWVIVAPAGIPAVLVKIPPGHYKRYRAAMKTPGGKVIKFKKGKHRR